LITRPRRVVIERAAVLGLVIGVLVGGLVAGRPAIISRPAVQPTIVALSRLPGDLLRAGPPDSGAVSGATSTPTRAPTATRTVMPTATPTVTRTVMPTVTAVPPTVAPTPTVPPTAAATATATPTATPEPSPLPPPSATDVLSQNEGVGAAAAAEVAPDAAAAVAGDPEIAALAARIHQVRADAERVALTWSPELAEAARIQAEDMAAHGFVSHTGSDGSDIVERMRRVGYDPAFRGEIIAWVPGGADLAFDWWWHSDLHHNTMLGAAYRDFGIARVPHPTRVGHNYFVVVFARR